jgi:hypothetical protein
VLEKLAIFLSTTPKGTKVTRFLKIIREPGDETGNMGNMSG